MEFFLNSDVDAALTFVTRVDVLFGIAIYVFPPETFQDLANSAISTSMPRFVVESSQNSLFVVFLADYSLRRSTFGSMSKQLTLDYVLFRSLHAEELFTPGRQIVWCFQGLEEVNNRGIMGVIFTNAWHRKRCYN